MSLIKVDTNSISVMYANLSRQCDVFEEVLSQIRIARSELDMRVSTARQINESLTNIEIRTRRQLERLNSYISFLNDVINRFVDSDKTISDRAKNIDYMLEKMISRLENGYKTKETLGIGTAWQSIAAVNAICGINSSLTNRTDFDGSSDDYAEYIKKMDGANIFGKYNHVIDYVEDQGFLTMMGYGILNWKDTIWATAKASLSGNDISDEYMNDLLAQKDILRDVVNKMNDNEDLKILSKNEKDALKYAEEIAKKCGMDISELSGFFEHMMDGAEAGQILFEDYNSNIAMLENLQKTMPKDSTLYKAADMLIEDYHNAARGILIDEIKKKADKSIGNLLDLAYGTSFGKVDSVIQETIGRNEGIKGLDTVININSLKASAISNYRSLAEIIQSGNYTEQDFSNFENSFNICKELTIKEYTAMVAHYKEGTENYKMLQEQIDQLKRMSVNNMSGSDGSFGAGGGGGIR
ncbi:MAG: hypothetical protein ACI4LP_09795 [Anaerovoracaceae bacterium]